MSPKWHQNDPQRTKKCKIFRGLQHPPNSPAVWELANASFIFHRWNQFALFRPLLVTFGGSLGACKVRDKMWLTFTVANHIMFT